MASGSCTTEQNAATTIGSNWRPAQWHSSVMAARSGSAVR
jgi:hypothetical protein